MAQFVHLREGITIYSDAARGVQTPPPRGSFKLSIAGVGSSALHMNKSCRSVFIPIVYCLHPETKDTAIRVIISGLYSAIGKHRSPTMAVEEIRFKLNTGAEIPALGLGTAFLISMVSYH